ncbi:hypothetical protein [Sporichthya sp.]|uniref:hypothetical protein n=1 Tax=Sporichthya sp. TaxID=65475 RepID=UPI00185AC260|nr:hypothetical protein [Sporichthya sp.]MBA3742320.1 hypothetical protein [Sporichthya sp.]
MPSHLHETLVAMFRHRPAFAAELLSGPLGRTVPHADAHLGSAEVVELRPAAHRADALVLLGDPVRPAMAIIVEVQLRRDEDKHWVWPEYLTAVRRRLRCPTVLLVVCTDRATALDRAPVDHAVEYARLVLAALPDLARQYLEELMATETFEYQSEFTRALEARGQARGEARGRAAMVLRILAARGVPVTDEVRERISGCTDLAQLEAWGDRSVVVGRAAELFT